MTEAAKNAAVGHPTTLGAAATGLTASAFAESGRPTSQLAQSGRNISFAKIFSFLDNFCYLVSVASVQGAAEIPPGHSNQLNPNHGIQGGDPSWV
ncbi:hypothetical protein HHL24_14120 [Paraburkholderia sp. RP-4-7]|uniref:Uncharacterized protein n=1 Tax=Paraburkholderia polaris TaxID=2728848 RepID=A0A848IHE5_9BURK|nr:hypothetical protein [Paraburkholderia polaris]NML99073.1 hypothetical protein [Paraburkholderia polaris]